MHMYIYIYTHMYIYTSHAVRLKLLPLQLHVACIDARVHNVAWHIEKFACSCLSVFLVSLSTLLLFASVSFLAFDHHSSTPFVAYCVVLFQ